jgi:hypothetical protein
MQCGALALNSRTILHFAFGIATRHFLYPNPPPGPHVSIATPSTTGSSFVTIQSRSAARSNAAGDKQATGPRRKFLEDLIALERSGALDGRGMSSRSGRSN